MTEAVVFDVPDAGTPNLNGQASPEVDRGPAGAAAAATALIPVPGWTQEEASRVVGGLVAGLTTVLYVMRHQAPPAPELMPAIAGDPDEEFPLLGMSLAPVLDFLAPKGSPQAIGVGIGAGVSEILSAMARRAPVLSVAPKQQQRPAPASAPQSAPEAPAGDGEGFRFRGDALRVLERAESPLAGLGIE